MKAYIYRKYGNPEVLCLEEVEKPVPNENEILVKAFALSINPAEWHRLTASFWLLRLSTGIFAPKHQILGADVAGIVVAIGKGVKNFKEGDRVFGRCMSGGLAEFNCLKETSAAKIPKSISFEKAATLPLAAVTALIALRDQGQLAAGHTVLINGASGGIGTFVVQLTKHFKATVTGICRTDNVDLVKSLGADYVIDYKKADFTSFSEKYDLIIDLIGNRTIRETAKLLNSKGKCVLVGMDRPLRLFGNMFHGMIISALSSKKITPMDAQVKSEDLAFIVQLVVEGKLQTVIDKKFDFVSVPEAFTKIGSRRTKGKVAVIVENEVAP